HFAGGGWCADCIAIGLYLGQPKNKPSLRIHLVHGRRLVLVSGALSGGKASGRALWRGAGDHELVVRTQCPGALLHTHCTGIGVLLLAQDHRSPHTVVQLVAYRFLGTGFFLRSGWGTPSGRRPRAAL